MAFAIRAAAARTLKEKGFRIGNVEDARAGQQYAPLMGNGVHVVNEERVTDAEALLDARCTAPCAIVSWLALPISSKSSKSNLLLAPDL
jgi:hypothetical protein